MAKQPYIQVEWYDWTTCQYESRTETNAEHEARLKTEARYRRSLAWSEVSSMANEDRKAGISLAWQMHRDGKPFPIHFDITWKHAGYKWVERYTLHDQDFVGNCFKDEDLIGVLGACKLCKRSAAVPADCTHTA